jgi:hypothetical protein
MRFALRDRFSAIAFVALTMPVISAQPAFADGAFITQATNGASFGHSVISNPVTPPSSFPYVPPHGGTTQATPETTVPATGANVAGTLEMGRNNFVLQAQAGSGNKSNVGILGSTHDNVAVLQHGQGLVSNLALVDLKGLSVDVLQPPGTAPVNMLIARLPNGMLDIVQPKGAPQASIVRVGNVLVVK